MFTLLHFQTLFHVHSQTLLYIWTFILSHFHSSIIQWQCHCQSRRKSMYIDVNAQKLKALPCGSWCNIDHNRPVATRAPVRANKVLEQILCDGIKSYFWMGRIPALEAALVKVMDEGRSYLAVDQEATEVTTPIRWDQNPNRNTDFWKKPIWRFPKISWEFVPRSLLLAWCFAALWKGRTARTTLMKKSLSSRKSSASWKNSLTTWRRIMVSAASLTTLPPKLCWTSSFLPPGGGQLHRSGWPPPQSGRPVEGKVWDKTWWQGRWKKPGKMG